ncbi:hypothetical protein Hypma_012717 [Hypsizygus marmoreus]|uniref:Uncharacterized protein n=1 Tax=Hypsizygus marmoreus TaxID=39966 RepID=A0A369JKP1_HYPMA|nr:hypothetical protein Hypma_012717 [Hypsizygus marmoreus]
MYPQRPPDLNVMEFTVLLALAEAAEKYEVYGLMYILKNRFRNILLHHGMEIIEYAAKHDYPDLIGIMAPQMLEKPLAEMLAILPPHLFGAWVLYRERWEDVRRKAFTIGCFTSLLNLDIAFQGGASAHLDWQWHTRWRQSIETNIKEIPEFTAFLGATTPLPVLIDVDFHSSYRPF